MQPTISDLLDGVTERPEYGRGRMRVLSEDPMFPLKVIRYLVDYGNLPGFYGEDGEYLDALVGDGELYGWFTVRRGDVKGGIETKMVARVTADQFAEVVRAFRPLVDTIVNCQRDFVKFARHLSAFAANSSGTGRASAPRPRAV